MRTAQTKPISHAVSRFLFYLKKCQARHVRNARATSKTDHLRSGMPTDNNITRTIKGRNCILRKTRAIKVCSARTGTDIPGRRCALLRYSRTKSLPNPPRVRVPASIRICISLRQDKTECTAQETRMLSERFTWDSENYH